MPARGLGPLAAALLLGLLLLGLSPGHGDKGAPKAGVCPELQGDQNCTKECVWDEDCADNFKCCPAGCASLCVLPNEKPGFCPQLGTGILPLGICHDQCKMDSECIGNMKCCKNGCGKVSCTTPNF
ncbi:WAP four-disulfide core domain protein 2-like [Rhynchocyon petersi]